MYRTNASNPWFRLSRQSKQDNCGLLNVIVLQTHKHLSSLFNYLATVLDSMGKIPSGLTDGVTTSFGEYDQCLGITSPDIVDYDDRFNIVGKYCLVRPYLPFSAIKDLENLKELNFLDEDIASVLKSMIKRDINTLKVLLSFNLFDTKFIIFNLGVCIPSPCTSSDLRNVLNQGLLNT